MARRTKLALGVAMTVVFLFVAVFATGAYALFFVPYNTTVVRIEGGELAAWKGRVRTIAEKRWGWFRSKDLEGHWGGGDYANTYTWRQFGYCNFSECLVLANNFGPAQFDVIIYENRFLGGGASLQAYLQSQGVGASWK